MKLTPSETLFVEKRAGLIKHWRWAGPFALLLVVVLAVWLWIDVPYLINPWEVIDSIEADTLPDSTINLMAIMLPVVMLLLIVFAISVILLAFFAISNERKLIRIIKKTSEFAGNSVLQANNK